MPILGRKDMEGITMSREGMTLEFIYYLLKENIKLKKENELLLDMFLFDISDDFKPYSESEMKGKFNDNSLNYIFCNIFLIAFFLIYQVVKGKQKRLGTYIMIVICLFVAVMFLYLVLTNQFQQINYNVPHRI